SRHESSFPVQRRARRQPSRACDNSDPSTRGDVPQYDRHSQSFMANLAWSNPDSIRISLAAPSNPFLDGTSRYVPAFIIAGMRNPPDASLVGPREEPIAYRTTETPTEIGPRQANGRLMNNHNLAEIRTAFVITKRLGHILEREKSIHHRLEPIR